MGTPPGHPDFAKNIFAYQEELIAKGQYRAGVAARTAVAAKIDLANQRDKQVAAAASQFTDDPGRMHADIVASGVPEAWEVALAEHQETLDYSASGRAAMAETQEMDERIASGEFDVLQEGMSVIGDDDPGISFEPDAVAEVAAPEHWQDSPPVATSAFGDAPFTGAQEAQFFRDEEYDMEYAGGGKVFRDTLALVGEEGPEYVKLPQGARVIPADATREMRRGRRPIPMAEGGDVKPGGLVFGDQEQQRASTLGWGDVFSVGGSGAEDPYFTTAAGLSELGKNPKAQVPRYSMADMQEGVSYPTPASVPGSWEGGLPVAAPSNIPDRPGPISNVAGVQEVLSGRPVRPLTGRLMRAANINVPSAQAWRNLSPEEREIYMDLVARSGVGEGYAQRAIQGARPASAARAGTARVLPLAARRY